MNTFKDNPFFILDANTWDTRAKLTEKADDLSFSGNEGSDTALSRLLQPQQRLKAELGWFPGRAPSGILEYVKAEGNAPFPALKGGDALGRFNALGACLLDYSMNDAATVSAAVKCLDEFWQQVVPDAVLNDINADRKVAGIDPVSDRDGFAAALREQRMAVTNAVAEHAGTAHARELGQAVMDLSRNHAQGRNQDILGDIADCYARLNAQQLQELNKVVRENAKSLKATEQCGSAGLAREVCACLSEQVEKWGAVFQPILKANAARAIPNTEALEIFNAVREAMVTACNKYGIVDECTSLSVRLKEIFRSEHGCAAKLDEDMAQLKKVKENAQAVRERKVMIENQLKTVHATAVRRQLAAVGYGLCPVCKGNGFVSANVMETVIQPDGRVMVNGRPGCGNCGGTGVVRQ